MDVASMSEVEAWTERLPKRAALAVEVAVEIEGTEDEESVLAEAPPGGEGDLLAAEDAEEIRLGEAAGDMMAGTEIVFRDGDVGAGVGPRSFRAVPGTCAAVYRRRARSFST
jgi:hypothetical protein